MTVSLEGYLEPQRMSFGSRPFSYDEAGHPFSPPLYGSSAVSHRRQSSLGFYPLQHWYPSSMAPRRSSSVSSHHTCIVVFIKLPVQSTFCLLKIIILHKWYVQAYENCIDASIVWKGEFCMYTTQICTSWMLQSFYLPSELHNCQWLSILECYCFQPSY